MRARAEEMLQDNRLEYWGYSDASTSDREADISGDDVGDEGWVGFD